MFLFVCFVSALPPLNIDVGEHNCVGGCLPRRDSAHSPGAGAHLAVPHIRDSLLMRHYVPGRDTPHSPPLTQT